MSHQRTCSRGCDDVDPLSRPQIHDSRRFEMAGMLKTSAVLESHASHIGNGCPIMDRIGRIPLHKVPCTLYALRRSKSCRPFDMILDEFFPTFSRVRASAEPRLALSNLSLTTTLIF